MLSSVCLKTYKQCKLATVLHKLLLVLWYPTSTVVIEYSHPANTIVIVVLLSAKSCLTNVV